MKMSVKRLKQIIKEEYDAVAAQEAGPVDEASKVKFEEFRSLVEGAMKVSDDIVGFPQQLYGQLEALKDWADSELGELSEPAGRAAETVTQIKESPADKTEDVLTTLLTNMAKDRAEGITAEHAKKLSELFKLDFDEFATRAKDAGVKIANVPTNKLDEAKK